MNFNKKLVTTVTLNPSWDYLLAVDRLEVGQVQRASRIFSYPSGKGVNVARVLSQLGQKVVATGFLGNKDAAVFIKSLKNEKRLRPDFCIIPGDNRQCVILNQQSTGSETVINPSSLFIVKPAQFKSLLIKVSKYARASAIVTLSGSIPRGADSSCYARLIEVIQESGASAYLDTKGPALLQALAKRPALVKITHREFEESFRCSLGWDTKSLIKALIKLRELGVQTVILSLGEKGSLSMIENKVWSAVTKVPLRPKGPTGSGDAFLAGFCKATLEKREIPEILSYATASALANLLNLGSGFVAAKAVTGLEKVVKVKEIKIH